VSVDHTLLVVHALQILPVIGVLVYQVHLSAVMLQTALLPVGEPGIVQVLWLCVQISHKVEQVVLLVHLHLAVHGVTHQLLLIVSLLVDSAVTPVKHVQLQLVFRVRME